MKHLVKSLIKIANDLDSAGLTFQASTIDGIISKIAGSDGFRKAADAFSKKVFEKGAYTVNDDLQAAAEMQRGELEDLARRCGNSANGKELASDIMQAGLDFDAFIKEQRASRAKSSDPKEEDALIADNVVLIKLIFALSDAARA